MVVHFQNGKCYRYNGVPEGVFVAVITDPDSQGKAFSRLIRSKDFPYQEIDLATAQSL